ncbi:hypothetical protein CROQUDRAFT_658230 [Cronartium quercuum f. sp. fusiforme G11]|uniref:Uncharacterized protein n=1 Tax=Cronartium quercuum f. sp. fusiforme G11 TaxID=708437 RepID=A0A9P6TBI2_9BASI|nr:hypothetical protein CROQUDRAFT_658230 [Cronartium quercuum f. sp. fusiforme G11]
MYLFPPSYTTSSYCLYCTSLPCLLYTSDLITSSHYHCFTTLYTTTTCLPSSNSRSNCIQSVPSSSDRIPIAILASFCYHHSQFNDPT